MTAITNEIHEFWNENRYSSNGILWTIQIQIIAKFTEYPFQIIDASLINGEKKIFAHLAAVVLLLKNWRDRVNCSKLSETVFILWNAGYSFRGYHYFSCLKTEWTSVAIEVILFRSTVVIHFCFVFDKCFSRHWNLAVCIPKEIQLFTKQQTIINFQLNIHYILLCSRISVCVN